MNARTELGLVAATVAFFGYMLCEKPEEQPVTYNQVTWMAACSRDVNGDKREDLVLMDDLGRVYCTLLREADGRLRENGKTLGDVLGDKSDALSGLFAAK